MIRNMMSHISTNASNKKQKALTITLQNVGTLGVIVSILLNVYLLVLGQDAFEIKNELTGINETTFILVSSLCISIVLLSLTTILDLNKYSIIASLAQTISSMLLINGGYISYMKYIYMTSLELDKIPLKYNYVLYKNWSSIECKTILIREKYKHTQLYAKITENEINLLANKGELKLSEKKLELYQLAVEKNNTNINSDTSWIWEYLSNLSYWHYGVAVAGIIVTLSVSYSVFNYIYLYMSAQPIVLKEISSELYNEQKIREISNALVQLKRIACIQDNIIDMQQDQYEQLVDSIVIYMNNVDTKFKKLCIRLRINDKCLD